MVAGGGVDVVAVEAGVVEAAAASSLASTSVWSCALMAGLASRVARSKPIASPAAAIAAEMSVLVFGGHL